MELKDLKDLLDIATKSLCAVTTEMRVELIKVPKDVDRMVVENLCLTSDQTCLDPVVLGNRIDKTFAKKKELMGQLKARGSRPPRRVRGRRGIPGRGVRCCSRNYSNEVWKCALCVIKNQG